LNEKYFLYGEEPDLFLKFSQFGYECRLDPRVQVIHFRDRSLNTRPVFHRYLHRLRAGYNIGHALITGYLRLVRANLPHDKRSE